MEKDKLNVDECSKATEEVAIKGKTSKRIVSMEPVYFIGNALIEARRNLNEDYITGTQLNRYIDAVADELKEKGIILCEKYDGRGFINEEHEPFIGLLPGVNGDAFFFVKPEITTSVLWREFRNFISSDILPSLWGKSANAALADKSPMNLSRKACD